MLRYWLWRFVLATGVVVLAGGAVAVTSTPAHADTYTSYLVAQLRHNPVYISAYADDAAPSDAAGVARALARIPLKAYVVDSVSAGPDGDLQASDLAAILHKQIGGGQLYILDRGSRGLSVSAIGFGTSLPVADAMLAAEFELNGGPSLIQLLQRFSSILLSGKTEQILATAGAQVERDSKGSLTPSAPTWAAVTAWTGGTVIGGGFVLLLALRRRRRLHPRFRPDTFRLSAVAGVVGLLGVAVAAHPATPATGPPTSASDGIGIVAKSLSPANPLYIDPDMSWMFTPAQVRQITAALRKSPVPTYVIAVPLDIDEDEFDYQGYFLDQLYARTHRNGAYLIVGPRGDILDAEYKVPRDISLPVDTEVGPDSMTSSAQIAASTPARVISLITDIDTSPQDPQGASMPMPEYSPGEFPNGMPTPALPPVLATPTSYAPVIADGLIGLLVIGPLLALLGLGGVRASRRVRAMRRGWGDSFGNPGMPVERMPASPHYGWLQHHARAELAELSRLIAGSSDRTPGWARACDDYDTGLLIVGGGGRGDTRATGADTGQIDLVGAIVLARDGRMALRHGTDEPPPPCLVNPLHGSAVTGFPADVIYRTPVLRDMNRAVLSREFPLCQRCAKLAADARRERYRGGGAPGRRLRARVLRVEFDGKRQRYDEFRSVWRKHSFGTDGPGLPQAVREHLDVS